VQQCCTLDLFWQLVVPIASRLLLKPSPPNEFGV
jgi:hypothetical protein